MGGDGIFKIGLKMKPCLAARYTLAGGCAIALVGLAGLVLIAGCAGAPGAVEDTVLLTGVAVDGPKTIVTGKRGGFTANAIHSDGGTEDITSKVSWSVVSGPGTVGEGGVYTAPADLTESVPVTIRASYSVSGLTYTQEAAFTATGSSLSGVGKVLAGVSISGPAKVAEGGTGKFSSTLTYNDGSTADVTANVEWSVGGTGTIGADGLYAAPSLVTSATSVTIRGTYRAAAGALSAEKTVQIANTSKVLTGVTISGPAVVAEGANGTYTVTATYDDASTKEVTADATWSVTNGPGAIAGGVYSVPGTVLADTPASLHVSYTESGLTTVASKSITVSAAVPGNQPPVANAGPDQTMADSDGDGLQAVTLYGIGSSDADGTIVSYVWNEGATKLATGATPIVTLPVGTHTLTLTVTDDGALSSTDTTVITVTQPAADPQTFSHYLRFYQIRYGWRDTQEPLPSDLVGFTLGYDYGHLTKYVYVSFTTILGSDLLDRASASGSAIMMNESELDDLFAQKAILSKYNVIAVSVDRIQKIDIERIQEEMFPGQHLNYGVKLNSSGDVILDNENNSIPDSAIEDYQNGKTIVYPVKYNADEPTRFFFNFNTPAVREYAIRYALKAQTKSAYRALFIDNFMTNDTQFVDATGTLHYVSAGTMEDQMRIVANHLIGILNEIRIRPDKDGLRNNGCILNNFRDNSPGQLMLLNEIDRQDKYSVFDMMMCENNFWEDYKCGNIEFYLTWTDKLKAHGKELIYAVSEDTRLDTDSQFVEDVWLWLHLVADRSYVYINNRYVLPMIDYSVYNSLPLGMPLEAPHKEGDTWIRKYQRGTISFDTSSGKMDSIAFVAAP